MVFPGYIIAPDRHVLVPSLFTPERSIVTLAVFLVDRFANTVNHHLKVVAMTCVVDVESH